MSRKAAWEPPPEFEEYRLVQLLGHGAMGEVHLAQDVLLERPVAIKFISGFSPSPARRERFLVEARAIARLHHPNVVAIYRVGEVQGRRFLVSEFVRGTTLERLPRPVPWQRALSIGVGLARGLAAAHRGGVLHRDIKPANVMLTEDGEVKLLDFGVAKLLSPDDGSDVVVEPVARRPLARSGPTPASTDPDLVTVSASSEDEARAATPRSADATVHEGGRQVPSSPQMLTAPGMAVGTPLYMAPEAWLGEGSSRASDIYSLGVLLYQLCAGRAPHEREVSDGLRSRVLHDPIVPLALAAPGIEPRLGAVVDRCLAFDPAERFDSGEALREALEELQDPAPAGGGSDKPYRGLDPFEPSHRDVFFGRGGDVRALLDRLRAERLVVVAGDSGVGKTSLCTAGVLPRILEGAIAPARRWTVGRMVAGRHPVAALAALLSPLLGEPDADVAERLRKDPAALVDDLPRPDDTAARTLLFLDQLEELVTQAPPEEAAVVARFLLALAAEPTCVVALAAARGDFISRLAALPGLGELLPRALYLLGPLQGASLREAIVGPARARGFSFESEALVGELLKAGGEAGSGLPLVQFALAELWEARDEQRRILPASALAAGGVAGALAAHAEAVLARLPPHRRAAARRVLLRLVTAEGTRQRRSRAELIERGPREVDPDQEAALEELVRGRLVVAREAAGGGGEYELAHEVLLGEWGTLRRWLANDGDLRAGLQRLERAAAEWDRLGRGAAGLWDEPQLREAAALSIEADGLSTRERRFLEASQQAARRRRTTRTIAVVAVPLAALAIYGGVRLGAMRSLDAQVGARLAEAAAERDRARAGNAEVERVRAEALGSFDRGEAAAGEAAWARALTAAAAVSARYGSATRAAEAALLLDGARRDARSSLATILYERALLAERDHRAAERDELVRRFEAYDGSGDLAARLHAPATLALTSQPPGAAVTLQRYEERSGALGPGTAQALGVTPLAGRSIAPGSYLLVVTAPDRPAVRYPVLLGRGEALAVEVPLPARVPAGMVYVPPGRFLYGSDDDERVRTVFLGAAPLHPVTTGAFLIARTETTWKDYLEFLRAQPDEARRQHTPAAATFFGAVQLLAAAGGRYQLRMKPASVEYAAREGEPIRFVDRDRRAEQDWSRMPVTAISHDDAAAYLAWLRGSGRLPGARFCGEREWERAARGADGRLYPGGNALGDDDANIDRTYGRRPGAFGPDEVGAHPASDSPFGVADLAGNVWEWLDAEQPGAVTYRGGSYYQTALTARLDNRQPGAERSQRSALNGLRVCATPEGG